MSSCHSVKNSTGSVCPKPLSELQVETPVPVPVPVPAQSKGLAAGAIAGIAVGAGVGLAVVLGKFGWKPSSVESPTLYFCGLR